MLQVRMHSLAIRLVSLAAVIWWSRNASPQRCVTTQITATIIIGCFKNRTRFKLKDRF